MAFLLKSTKFIHNLIGLACQRAPFTRRGKILLLRNPNIFVFNELRARTVVSFAVKDIKENDKEELERSVFELSKDVQLRNIFLEDAKHVFEGIKQTGEITNLQILLLLKCCGQVSFMSTCNERIQLAEEIWKSAADLGLQFQISHYNALLNVFLENNHKFSPSEFLSILRKEGLEPNLMTYRRILKAYCQQGDFEGANRILEEMKSLNHPLNAQDFNALIECQCKIGDLQKAADIINIMKEKDIDPTSKSYIYLLCEYAKSGEIDKLKAMLKELPEKDIYVTDANLLEVIYTMAVNGHTAHIKELLPNLAKNTAALECSAVIIHRLLHDKLDSVAFQIFLHFHESGIAVDQILRQFKFILQHFVRYRTPKEVVNLCTKFDDKGWTTYAVNIILRESFDKDENFNVDLLSIMKNEDFKIRSHYFWPAIIKASKNGNSNMFEVLKAMPRELLLNCLQTSAKIVIPNFQHGDDWLKDYETLKNLGVNKRYLVFSIFEKLLMDKKFEEVEKLASTLPMGLFRNVVTSLTEILKTHLDQDKLFVNVIYYLAHDYLGNSHSSDTSVSQTEEKSLEDMHLFDFTMTTLINSLKDEQVVLRVLENMLEKKMAITEATGSSITSLLPSQSIREVVEKLTDPDLKFQLDEEIYKRKNGTGFASRRQNSAAGTEATERVEYDADPDSCLNAVRKLITEKKFKEGIKVLEDLAGQEGSPLKSQPKKLYLQIVYEFCRNGYTRLAEKAVELGILAGLLTRNDYLFVIRHLLSQKDFTQAIEQYKKFSLKHNTVFGCQEFLVKVVAEGNKNDISNAMTMLANFIPEQTLMIYMSLALARNGKVKQAKQILDSRKLKVSEQQFYTQCEIIYEVSTSEIFEHLLELVKDMDHFDRVPLFKLLLKKYAKEGKLESAKQLWMVIEEDDISNYGFLEQMHEFLNDPTLEHLQMFTESFDTSQYFNNVSFGSIKRFLDEGNQDSLMTFALTKCNRVEHLKKLLIELAFRGKVKEVLRILQQRPNDTFAKVIAVSFLKGKKPREYIEFLQHFLGVGKYNAISGCFNIFTSLGELENDQELFEQYRSCAIECFEKGRVELPLNCLFVTCLRIKDKVQVAEKILDEHPNHFGKVEFIQLQELARPFRELEICQNILSSQKLRSHFSDALPLIYSRVIKGKCNFGDLEGAVDTLKEAVAEGFGKSLSRDEIADLAEKLKASGRSFPHPELLESNS